MMGRSKPMADTNPSPIRRSASRRDAREQPALHPEDYRESFGEELSQTLNVQDWRSGRDLGAEYRRIEEEVREAVSRESGWQRRVREEVHPKLAWSEGAPKGAGRYAVPAAELEEITRGLLFNGGVEACDGTIQIHDTLLLTMYQIGVSLVSYSGDQGSWYQRLFRRDLRQQHADPIEEALELLERRDRRNGLNHAAEDDLLSQLAQRGIMSYAERAILLRQARAVWRMGHGSPAPHELFANLTDLTIESIKVIRGLVENHQKFVYVASEGGTRMLLTIGDALYPLEYAIVGTLQERLAGFFDEWRSSGPATVDTTWDGCTLTPEQWVQRFRDEVAPKVVVGVYRATLLSPAQLFYAHEDHADVAARIALADSVLQEERGFPLLITLADRVCGSVYGGGSLNDLATAAYAAAGVPFRYQSERATRPR
jgi:hypothetical protein